MNKVLLVVFCFVFLMVSVGLVSAANCPGFLTQNTCEANTDCRWKIDPWGSWCEQKGCWNFYDQTSCGQSNNASSSQYFINKSCSWTSLSNSWCTEVDCWIFDGDITGCLVTANNTYGLRCAWDAEVDQWGSPCMGPPEKQCWSQMNQSSCQNNTGCEWGMCRRQSCWEYTDNGVSACQAAVGYNGKNCVWKVNSWGTECMEKQCWNFNTSTHCATDSSCNWQGSSCMERSCSDFSGTNIGACINNTANLSCSWDSNTNWCGYGGCWGYNTQNTCGNASGCFWETYSGGWCQEQGCWNWGGNNASCINISLHPGLNCINDNATGQDWCYENVTAKSCSSLTTQMDCINSNYCFWNTTAAASSACRDPVAGQTQNVFVEWNPGCYIFDTEPQVCQNTTGCYNTSPSSKCFTNMTKVPTGQLNCSSITNGTRCNSIPMFSTCCKWQGNNCVADRFDQTCKEDMQEPPEGAWYCEDYIAYTDNATCLTISGNPWFMPCYWNTTLDRCLFKGSDVFGTGERNVLKIDNEKNCIAAGGEWSKETYPSSNDNTTAVQLSLGRCDFKFNDERNCDKDCYACEFGSDKTNWSTAKNAKDACVASKLGICEFIEFASRDSQGRLGKCEPKKAFKSGLITGDCRTDCSSCTYMGNPSSSSKFTSSSPSYESCLAPSCYCDNSPAKCKWIVDPANPTDEAKGRCGQGSEKTCADRCDKCYDQTICNNQGGKQGNTSKAAVCSWSNNICTYTSNASQMEVCWNGIDDNSNNKIDCADSMCFSDDFCGGGFMFSDFGVDCFMYNTNGTACANAGCAWVSEGWGSWCDMPGAVCWKYDGNQTACAAQAAYCDWHSGFGGMCETDWDMSSGGGATSNCMNPDVHNNRTACLLRQNVTYNCTWVENTWCTGSGGGGYCDPNPAYTGTGWYNCVQHDDDGELACESAGTPSGGNYPCLWYVDSWCQQQGVDAGHCDHMSYACPQFDNNQSGCIDAGNETFNHSVWCGWSTTSNLCNSKAMSGGSGSCWEKANQALCEATSGCSWKTGFCDPKGFGGEKMAGMVAGGAFGGAGGEMMGSTGGGMAMGGSGMQCFKYDGNKSTCDNTTGCGWFNEPWPFCDINFGSNCPQYSYNITACNNISLTGGRCKWHPTGDTGFCDEKPLECYWNTTLQTDLVTCGTIGYCDNSSGTTCSPVCFNASLSSEPACGVNNSIQVGVKNESLCRWVGGWCNPKMTMQFFKDMDMSAPPIPLGTDRTDSGLPSEVDILDFGMKDMGKAKGFGIRVRDMANASACNGVKMSSGITGTGQNITKFYWYLDTDSNSANNCNASHNSSLSGFEFRIQNQWTYDSSSGSVTESPKVYRCSEGSWILADIKLSSERKMMCSKFGGAMVGVDMVELEKFPSLYTTGVDLRVAVASADALGNSTSVSDQASPGWATPGAFDFNVNDFNMFKKEDNAFNAAGKEGADKGYVDYGADADCWTQSGCGNYSCKGHPYCDQYNYGVEAAGYTDTRVPTLVGVIKESYPNSSFITYFTNKPANGTLYFYGNDSTCASGSLNATIYDPAVGPADIKDLNLREYKLWHIAEIYNESKSNYSLNYDLRSSTAYYFKIRICDEEGKCGESKCSDFVTESSETCSFCRFVSRIKAPWSVYYDLDQDGSYEHWQGHILNAQDGMLTNYSSGRRANLILNTTDGLEAIEFLNVTLTKTGMSPNIKDIELAENLKNGTTTTAAGITIGYAGMIEEVRDKIVNNLYPHDCRITIPKGATSCDQLWQCNSSVGNCVNRTANATKVANTSTTCTWKIPYCEFSTYAGGQPGTPAGGSSSSSSGGGGSSSTGDSGAAPLPAATAEETVEETPVEEEESPTGAAAAGTAAAGLVGEEPTEKEGEAMTGKGWGNFAQVLLELSWLWVTILILAIATGFGVYIYRKKKGSHGL